MDLGLLISIYEGPEGLRITNDKRNGHTNLILKTNSKNSCMKIIGILCSSSFPSL